MWLHAFMKI